MRSSCVLLLTALVTAACDNATIDATGPGDRPARSVAVIVEPVQFDRQRTRLSAVGTSRASRSVELFPETAGEVIEVSLAPGQAVNQGDVLLRLEQKDEALAVQLAEIQYADSRRLLDRYERAKGTGAVIPTTLDEASTAAETARITLERARVALQRRTLSAPFSGYVGITEIDVGDRVGPDTLITTLDDRDPLLVRFEVPEALVEQLTVGDAVAVSTWNNAQRSLSARVVDIGSRIDPSTRTMTVQATLENQSDLLRPGMSFRVALTLEGAEYALVPEVALRWGEDGSYVWVAKDGSAERVPAAVVQRRKGQVLVETRLTAEDLIVVEGVQRVRDGVPLQFTPPAGS